MRMYMLRNFFENGHFAKREGVSKNIKMNLMGMGECLETVFSDPSDIISMRYVTLY
jgi:hypothetical protein